MSLLRGERYLSTSSRLGFPIDLSLCKAASARRDPRRERLSQLPDTDANASCRPQGFVSNFRMANVGQGAGQVTKRSPRARNQPALEVQDASTRWAAAASEGPDSLPWLRAVRAIGGKRCQSLSRPNVGRRSWVMLLVHRCRRRMCSGNLSCAGDAGFACGVLARRATSRVRGPANNASRSLCPASALPVRRPRCTRDSGHGSLRGHRGRAIVGRRPTRPRE